LARLVFESGRLDVDAADLVFARVKPEDKTPKNKTRQEEVSERERGREQVRSWEWGIDRVRLRVVSRTRCRRRESLPDYRPMVIFAAATGLRPAEWLALEWHDVDLEARVVYVHRSSRWGS
jgi:integrase